MERYIEKDGKQLRFGVTTGTCATGATLAAVRMLHGEPAPGQVVIHTPKGWDVTLEIAETAMGSGWASASVVKDAGDDPDITDGATISATLSANDTGDVRFFAGEGVGTVTKKGLRVPPGEAAINPGPREMIRKVLEPYITPSRGYDVTVSVLGGAELAQKTFNPRLGIEGGISIIGTSGIVEPMSEEALKESLALELSVQRALGKTRIIFSPGNYGKDWGEQLGLLPEDVVKTSNYVGYMLDQALRLGFEEILWVGHLGKLIKVAAGIFQTHSSVADGRLETLGAYAGAAGASQEEIQNILNSNTTEEAVEVLIRGGHRSVFKDLARAVSRRSMVRTGNGLRVGTILFTLDAGVLAMDDPAEEMLEALKQ